MELLKYCENLSEELSKYQGKKVALNWLIPEVLKFLSDYPGGVTPAVLKQEVTMRFLVNTDPWNVDAGSRNRIKVASLRQGKCVSGSAVLHAEVCKMELEGVIVTAKADMRFTMYLHQRFRPVSSVLFREGRKFRAASINFTSQRGSVKIMPSEVVLFILDGENRSDEELVKRTDVEIIRGVVVQIGQLRANEILNSLPHLRGRPVRTRRVRLESGTSQQNYTLLLFEDQVHFGAVLEKGQELCIFCPYRKENILFYDDNTVICAKNKVTTSTESQQFAVREISQKSQTYSQISLQRSCRKDFEYYPDRVKLSKLEPHTANISLWCKVISDVENVGNRPVLERDRLTQSFRVSDGDDEAKVFAYDMCSQISKLQCGDYCFLRGLQSALDGGQLFLHLGMGASQGNVFRVHGVGLITTPMLRPRTIKTALQLRLDFFIVDALVKMADPISQPEDLVIQCHTLCGRAIKDENECSFCGIRVSEQEYRYSGLELQIEDGTGTLKVQVNHKFTERLLECSSNDFVRSGDITCRLQRLDTLKGRKLRFLVVEASGGGHRLLAVSEIPDYVAFLENQ